MRASSVSIDIETEDSILHYRIDEGVRMASTYHSIISVVSLKGKSVCRFFGDFFTD